MTIFWILAAGLAALGVLFVVLPLLARQDTGPGVDQDRLNLEVFRQQVAELDADLESGKLDRTQYKAARRDLERELLYDVDGLPHSAEDGGSTRRAPLVAVLAGLAVPVFAFGLYLAIGDTSIISRLEMAATGQGSAQGHAGAGGEQPLPSMDVLVERLAAKMAENPDNLEGWVMLGRSYFAINQPAKALQALEQAFGLAPENPEVILSYAQAIAANSQGRLAGRPAELIAEALEIDPGSPTGRWLDGLRIYQTEDFAGAVSRWESLLADLDPESEEAAELREFIADARERAGASPSPAGEDSEPVSAEVSAATPAPETATEQRAPPMTAEAAASDDEGTSLTVKVSLAEPLWKQADVNRTLFVYAKAVSGPPMPLAVKQLRTGDLPVTVTLDDSMAMMPAMRLSAFPEVTVGARISASGQATPGSGDLEGEVGPVKPGVSGPVEVVINRVRP